MSLKEPHEDCRFYFYTPELALARIPVDSVQLSLSLSLPDGAIADR